MPQHYSDAQLIDGLRRAYCHFGAEFSFAKAAKFLDISSATLAARLGGTIKDALRTAGIPWPLPKAVKPAPTIVYKDRKKRPPDPIPRDVPKTLNTVLQFPLEATQKAQGASNEPKAPRVAREDRLPPPGASLEEMSAWFSGPGLRLAAESYAQDVHFAQYARQIAEVVKILRQTLGTDKSNPVPQGEITIKRAIIPDNGRGSNVIGIK